MELHGKWLCATLEADEWLASEIFDTKEQAIQAGLQACRDFNNDPTDMGVEDVLNFIPDDSEEIMAFQVGQLNQAMPYFNVDCILEHIAEQTYNMCSIESAEDYLDNVKEEDKVELDKFLRSWFTRHNYLPNFYDITNQQTIIVD